jgi:hypothetical protein
MNYENIAEEIIGLPIKEAAKIVKEHGYTFRVANSNGISFLTTDTNPNRINVRVDKNEITEVLSIG